MRAIGARRTTHSAVVGSYGESAGLRRELACLTLANQAVEKVEATNLLLEGSARSEYLVNLFRVMIYGESMPSANDRERSRNTSD